MKRAPRLQKFLDTLAEKAGISQAFQSASDHPGTCTCPSCREWWLTMGPNPDTDSFGPFGKSLWPEWEARIKNK